MLGSLERLGVRDVQIDTVPNEVAVAVPFPEDVALRPYERDRAREFAAALLRTDVVFERFRAGFLGKASPVQFFWGSFDLAAARFSGRRAPVYAGGTPPNVNVHVMHEAYSHELISAGFWPGNADVPRAEYYAYAMPAIDGVASAKIRPAAARWDASRGEFLLPYEAAADLAGRDRALLEDPVQCECVSIPPRMRGRARPIPPRKVGV